MEREFTVKLATRVLLLLVCAVLSHGQTFTIATSPTSMTFTATVGGSASSQKLGVGVAAGITFQVSAGTSSGGNWLSVTPGSGTASASFTVKATPGTLAAGTYQGAITVTSSGASNSPLQVPVTFV